MGGFWDQFEQDPRDPGNSHLRAADRDRDVVTTLLGAAYADGRLTREELDERTDQVTASRRLGDLPPIVTDLVSRSPVLRRVDLRAQAESRYRRERREAFFAFLTPSLICWAIWIWVLFTGHGTPFPWPIFVSIGTGARFGKLLFDKEDRILAIQQRLEKHQAKALDKQRPWGGGQPA